jgi:hypothetical protein
MSFEHSPVRQRRGVGTLGTPRYGRISKAVERSGLSRSSLYKLGTKHHGLFKKYGTAVFIDFVMLDDIIADALTDAKLNITIDD